MICTISSRTSPRPPGNWCEARSVVGAASAALHAAARAPASSALEMFLILSPPLTCFSLSVILYHPGRAQPAQLVCALPEQVRQHPVGVLAEQGRRLAIFDRRAGEAHRARHHRQLRAGAMLELEPDAACLDLRLVEHLRQVIDRTVRYACGFEKLHPLCSRLLGEDFSEKASQLRPILDALAIGGEARIGGERGAARRLAELAEQVVVAAGEDYVAVARAEWLVGHDVGMQVAD